MAEHTFQPTWRRPGPLRRAARHALGTMPFLVWIGAIAGIALLLRDRTGGTEFFGLAEAGRHTVSTMSPGRLSGVTVRVRDVVAPGQVLATLDDGDLTLRLASARAELERLRAESDRQEAVYRAERDAAIATLGSDREAERRRFVRDREAAAIDMLLTKASIEEDRLRRQGLAIERDRLAPLVEQGLAAESEWTRIVTEHDALAERITRTELVLADRNAVLEAAERRIDGFESAAQNAPADVADALVAPLRWSIEAQNIAIETIALERTRLQLRAPVGGEIEEIRMVPGQVLAAGDVLLTIVAQEPRALVAFVPEHSIRKVAAGMLVHVTPASAPRHRLTTRVEAIGPATQLVPQRFWLDPRVEQWALPVYLEAPPESFARPGEALRVQFVAGSVGGNH